MTNKPMLSVERELVERIVGIYTGGLHRDGVNALHELRALLEQETPEQEGVRLARNNPNLGSNLWGETHRVGDEFTRLGDAYYAESLKLPPAAQHQGEPVNRLTYSQGDRRYVNGWNDACSHWEERPAPVAVVMPGRKCPSEYRDSPCTQTCMAGEYNRALDDAARLNGVKP